MSLDWGRISLGVVQAIGLFVVATFVFDAIHFTLHQFQTSRWNALRRLGGLHQAHHDFFDQRLEFHEDQTRRNLIWHVLPEYGTQMAVCALGLTVLPWPPVVDVMAVFTALFIGVLCLRGKDHNHVASQALSAAHEAFWVRAPYHSLHHVYPEGHLSSYTTLFDRVMGTACPLRGRTVALTGASGAFGSALKGRLERLGAIVVPLKFGRDFTYDDTTRADEVLRRAEVLALCHGAKGVDAQRANCDSFVALIERFRALARGRLVPPEIWAVGSEIECHPAFGVPELVGYARSKRAFARHGAAYFHDKSVLYRHIVPSAFRSRMGPGLMSGETAAFLALFLIRRGFRYVPVTYTGIALVNALPFGLRARVLAWSGRRN